MKLPSYSVLALGLALFAGQELRAQFISVDVGSPASAGSTTLNSGGTIITNVGGGTDIWGTGDQFHYYYTNIVGNYDVKCRVTLLTNSPTTGYANQWVKAELMARLPDPSFDPAANAGDPFFGMMTTRTNASASGNLQAGQNEVNIQFRQIRNSAAGNTGTPPNVLQPWAKITPTYPNQWLRVQRIGSVLFGYTGNNGSTWQLIYTADTANDPAWNTPEYYTLGGTNAWGSTNLIGLAICSHDNTAGRTAYSVSDNLTFSNGVTGVAIGNRTGFTALAGLVGLDYITNVTQVKLDGNDITSLITFTNGTGAPAETTVIFPGFGTNQVANSQHTVVVAYATYQNLAPSATMVYTVPNFATVATNSVVPLQLASLDTTKVGFNVRSYQSYQNEPNSIRWAEEQLAGLRGHNIADQSLADANGNFTWTNVLLFGNQASAGGPFVTDTNGLQAYSDFSPFGISSSTPPDNTVLEFSTWMYFPTQGVYQVYVGSDDAFAIMVSANNPLDRLGSTVMTASFAQTPATFTAYNIQWVINQPGAYPVRILWENGTGGAGFQMYAAYDSGYGTNLYIPINDDGHISGVPSPIQCYQPVASTVAGPYVKKLNPVSDSQNVVYYQPIHVELGDGLGGAAVNPDPSKIVLTSATGSSLATQVTNNVSIVKSGTTTSITLLPGTYPQWTNWFVAGQVTNTLYFQDMNGANYAYTWTFNMLNTAGDFASNTVAIAASQGVALSQLDTSKPGFRVKSYQSPHNNPNNSSWSEEQLEGLHGPNVADQSQATSGYYVWNALIDFHYAGSGFPSMAVSGGQWRYDAYQLFPPDGNASFGSFGIGSMVPDDNPLAPYYRFEGNNKMESCALDIGTWLYFPKAGSYLMQVNSDDGFAAYAPQGNPFGKLGTTLSFANVGRGVGGAQGGADTQGTLFSFNIPAPGAYPFRLLYENGGTGAGMEVSIYQFLPDGSVARVPLNDTNQPYSIRAYQTLNTGSDSSAPYVSYLNPVRGALDIVPWQPVVAELSDGPGTSKAVNTNTIQLLVDGFAQPVAVTQPATGLTRIVQQLNVPWATNSAHTVALTYQSADATAYSNSWNFTAMGGAGIGGILPYAIPTIPATNGVATSLVDHSKPGFRVKVQQFVDSTTTPAGVLTNITRAEQGFAGLMGTSIATPAPGGYWVWTNAIDFADNIAVNADVGEFRYNYSFTNYLGIQAGNLSGGAIDAAEAIFAGWMEFPQAGTYAMSVNSDDGFKVISPYGNNPFAEAGYTLAWVDGTRGATTGGAYPPTGSARTHFVFNVPAPGAYPIRLLWYNGTGGASIEWTMYQYLPNGSVARLLVNDTNTPGAIQVYQSLLNDTAPYVAYIDPLPGLVQGSQPNQNWQSTPIPGSTINGANNEANLTVTLQDGTATVDLTSVQLTFNGVVQPITVSNYNGVTTITRVATNAFWPSGQLGPLIVSYKDSNGANYSYPVENIATPFWGTLTNPITKLVDTTKPGFKLRAYQLDPKATVGSTVIPTRVHVAEQVLTGLWGTNAMKTAAFTNGGYCNLLGTGPNTGTINFNLLNAAQIGDFQSPTFTDQVFPGIPGTVTATVNSDTNNDFVNEILAYVEFPTNGTYYLGVNSDDGFRLTSDWNPPTNKGAVMVNTPANLSGFKPTVQNTFLTSYSLTSAITGDLVLVQGPYGAANSYGSTNHNGLGYSIDGSIISNGGQLAGKIALMYRSGYVGYGQQVQNAVAAGAIGVILIQNRPATEGPFPQEPSVAPPQSIPAVQIEQADGDALIAALVANTPVNVTLNPMDYLINPPPVNPVLGQADVGKGASDIIFPVVVEQAGVYPLRLLHFQGGGGGNLEFFTVTGNSRVLVNDLTATTGPGPNGTGLRAWFALAAPSISQTVSGNNLILTFTGTLQMSTDLVTWQDLPDASPLTVPMTGPQAFYRAKMVGP